MNIFIESSGCSRRKLDVAKFHTYFRLNGYEILDSPEQSDYILVTTCAFKKEEEENSFAAIKEYEKYNAKVIVYGCLPDISPSRFHKTCDYEYITPKQINEIDSHFPQIRHKFADVSDANIMSGEVNHSSWSKAFGKFVGSYELSKPFIRRSFQYLRNRLASDAKRQYHLFTSRGCLGACSYCAVRYAVGRIQSKQAGTLLMEFERGLKSGFRDFILLGDDVGAYGQDIDTNFPALLAALIEKIRAANGASLQKPVKLHIEEINPRWLIQYRREFMDLVESPYVASLLCPVQSANDRVLGLMNRGHTVQDILQTLQEFSNRNHELKLHTQIIVGFPSETEDELEETLTKIVTIPFESVTIFPYDEKENTEAAKIQPKMPENVIKARIVKAQKYLGKHKIRPILSCNER